MRDMVVIEQRREPNENIEWMLDFYGGAKKCMHNNGQHYQYSL
jgi:hypothetical protein